MSFLRVLAFRHKSNQRDSSAGIEIGDIVNEVTIKPKHEEKTFTQAEFMQMLQMMLQQSQETTLKAIEKFKEPDEFTKEKQENERKREAANRRDRMQAAIDEERGKEARWFHCKHQKTAPGIKNPSHGIMGQVN